MRKVELKLYKVTEELPPYEKRVLLRLERPNYHPIWAVGYRESTNSGGEVWNVPDITKFTRDVTEWAEIPEG